MPDAVYIGLQFWIFEYAGGISIPEGGEGYSRVRISPIPDKRLGFVDIGIQTKYGELSVYWKCEGDIVDYKISVPQGMTAEIEIDGRCDVVCGGEYRLENDKNFIGE